MLAPAACSGEAQLMGLTRALLQHQLPQLQQCCAAAHICRMQSSAPQHQHRQRGGRWRSNALVCRARRASLAEHLKELREEDDAVEQEPELPAVTQLSWSSPLTVLQYPHPKLRAPNAPVGAFGPELQQLADAMFDVMYRDDGVGLAAPQVGINIRLMVFNPTGERGQGEELVLANPRIVSASRKQELGEEGCLSFLKLNTSELILADVERHTNIKVEAQDVNGERIQRTYTDWTARIFQHEYDHLQGTLFPDRVKKPARKAIQPFLTELEQHWQKTAT